MNNLEFIDKKVAVLGVGIEGAALAVFLKEKGVSDITLLDKLSEEEIERKAKKEKNLFLEKILSDQSYKRVFGDEYLDGLEDFDIIFRSPGIPYLNTRVQQAKRSGVVISSQIKLFLELCPCQVIGVTGTKGKGTTASLIYEILKKNNQSSITDNQNREVYLAGNIGEPAITLLDKINDEDIAILELSSFQLQDVEISPHIAVVLNITVDHLDYHENEIEYREAKLPIVKYQSKDDFLVVNQDYLSSVEFAENTPASVMFFSAENSVDQGSFVRMSADKDLKEVVLRVDGKEEIICNSDDINLVGDHNLENVAAASCASFVAGAKIEEIKKSVRNFVGLPHRLEFVGEVNGVKYFNDSFATNPGPTIAAINSFAEPKILILGGSSKGADFSELADKISNTNIKKVILIGLESERIFAALGAKKYSTDKIFRATDLADAVYQANKSSLTGDVILFSPACASFDMFDNYKDRGNKFKIEVKKLQ